MRGIRRDHPNNEQGFCTRMIRARDTIFAISSGSPPAAIGIVRVSGPEAQRALTALTGRSFTPRMAVVSQFRGPSGSILDEGLVLWFPGPKSATGEDCAELHCHGGRAVIAAVCDALAAIDGLRPAEPGEFTRRAFSNGRIDLAQAEGLADLLEAETELQRATAMANAEGALSRYVDEWREGVLRCSAQIEAVLDFSDEEDATDLPASFTRELSQLIDEMGTYLARPKSDRLGEGFRVVFAGPPNSGKSTLFNAIVESEAAITSPIAGTTRDVIERAIAIAGVPFTFVDTAGLRDRAGEEIEALGIERARAELARADVVAWLGAEGQGPEGALEIDARSDVADRVVKQSPDYRLSAVSGEGLFDFKRMLVNVAMKSLPKPGMAALNARQHGLLGEAHDSLASAQEGSDPLLVGEDLRRARLALDRLIGRTTTEDMLDALFGRFCIGK